MYGAWIQHQQPDADTQRTRSGLEGRVYQQASSIAYGSNPKPSTALYRRQTALEHVPSGDAYLERGALHTTPWTKERGIAPVSRY